MQNKKPNEGALGQSQQVAKKQWRVSYSSSEAEYERSGGRMRIFENIYDAQDFAHKMREDGRFEFVEVIEL